MIELRVDAPEARVAKGEIRCDRLIPDNDLAGTAVPIALDAPGTAERIQVSVQIQHTYVGDLRIELVAPSGKRAVMRDRTGGQEHDIRDTYAVDGLLGEAVAGAWALQVTDLAGRDIGRVDWWSIEVGWKAAGNKIEKQITPNLAIPDNDPAGVTSTSRFLRRARRSSARWPGLASRARCAQRSVDNPATPSVG